MILLQEKRKPFQGSLLSCCPTIRSLSIWLRRKANHNFIHLQCADWEVRVDPDSELKVETPGDKES